MAIIYIFRKIRERERATGAGQPLLSNVETGKDGNKVFHGTKLAEYETER